MRDRFLDAYEQEVTIEIAEVARSVMDDNNFILNGQQFAFMNKYQIDIMIDDFGGENIVSFLINSPEYSALFGEMEWDDAYDRYSDTPGFKPLPITVDEFDTDATIIEKLKHLWDQIGKSSEKTDRDEVS